MKIGDIELAGNVILGPMAGVTTLAYREFMKPFGVALTVSEMISDCGISYGNAKTFDYLKTSQIERPVALQIFGSDIKNTANAIQTMQKCAIYDVLDINFGCPVHKVVKTGAGSSWLRNVEGLKQYASEIVKVSEKPVTAKIRLGWDQNSINVFEVARDLEESGVKAIAIHCRTASQAYAGKADYSAIKGLRVTISIPLIVSGDIFSLEDAIKAVNETNADGVMVARGGLGNPFLITQIDRYFKTGEILPDPTRGDQLKYAKDFAYRLIELKGSDRAVNELRGILPHFFSSFPGYKKIRLALATSMRSVEDMEIIFNEAEKEFRS